jgi:hypothetical protein
VKKEIPSPAGNQTPASHYIVSNFTHYFLTHT